MGAKQPLSKLIIWSHTHTHIYICQLFYFIFDVYIGGTRLPRFLQTVGLRD